MNTDQPFLTIRRGAMADRPPTRSSRASGSSAGAQVRELFQGEGWSDA